MIKMDPWTNFDNCTTSSCNVNSDSIDSFEDNFNPFTAERLPDSKEYLAKLEQRLRKIKNDPDVLKQLAEKREACMQQLLFSQCEVDDETIDLNTPIDNSTILRAIAPQKQALTQGELVELVKYDQLIEEKEEEESRESKTLTDSH